MSELLLVNPRRRAKTKTRRRRPMTALQRKYFGPKRRRRTPRRVETLVTNPAPRRRRRRSSIGKITRRITHRSYGSFSPVSFFHDMLVPSAIGAAGALATDVALGYASPYLPQFFKTGTGRSITKIAAAVGISAVAAKFASKRIGNQIIAGAAIVTLYGVFHDFLKAKVPTLSLMGEMEELEMAEYVDGLGYMNPAMVVDGDMEGLGRHRRRRPPPPPQPWQGQPQPWQGQPQLGPGINASVPPPISSGQFGPGGGASRVGPGGQGGPGSGVPSSVNPMMVQGFSEYVDGYED